MPSFQTQLLDMAAEIAVDPEKLRYTFYCILGLAK